MALIFEGGITISSGITIAPEAAPTPDITASIDFAYDASYNSGSFGYVRPEPPSQAGFGTIASQTPVGIIGSITYSPTYASTTITFKTGTYTGGNGTLVVTTPWRINGQDGNYSVTIADVTQTMSQGPGGYNGLLIAGDPFNLQSQFLIGNVAVEIDLPAFVPGVTYTQGTDYTFYGALMNVDLQTFSVEYSAWSNAIGRDALLALGSGSQIQIFGPTNDGPLSYVITFTSGWTEAAGVYTISTVYPVYANSFYAYTVTLPA